VKGKRGVSLAEQVPAVELRFPIPTSSVDHSRMTKWLRGGNGFLDVFSETTVTINLRLARGQW